MQVTKHHTFSLASLVVAMFALSCGSSYRVRVTTYTGDEPKRKGRIRKPQRSCGDKQVRKLLHLTNESRSKHGVSSLECSNTLSKAAYRHAADMCERGYMDHESPDGATPADRAVRAGLSHRAVGENISVGEYLPDEVHRGWMTSNGHRKNILRRSFVRVGFGAVPCEEHSPVWVQVFEIGEAARGR